MRLLGTPAIRLRLDLKSRVRDDSPARYGLRKWQSEYVLVWHAFVGQVRKRGETKSTVIARVSDEDTTTRIS